MKVIFEEKDIKTGMFIIKDTFDPNSDNFIYACTIVYKIGYIGSAGGIKSQKWCLISALTDGMVLSYDTLDKLVYVINLDNFRPLSDVDLLNILKGRFIGKLK